MRGVAFEQTEVIASAVAVSTPADAAAAIESLAALPASSVAGAAVVVVVSALRPWAAEAELNAWEAGVVSGGERLATALGRLGAEARRAAPAPDARRADTRHAAGRTTSTPPKRRGRPVRGAAPAGVELAEALRGAQRRRWQTLDRAAREDQGPASPGLISPGPSSGAGGGGGASLLPLVVVLTDAWALDDDAQAGAAALHGAEREAAAVLGATATKRAVATARIRRCCIDLGAALVALPGGPTDARPAAPASDEGDDGGADSADTGGAPHPVTGAPALSGYLRLLAAEGLSPWSAGGSASAWQSCAEATSTSALLLPHGFDSAELVADSDPTDGDEALSAPLAELFEEARREALDAGVDVDGRADAWRWAQREEEEEQAEEEEEAGGCDLDVAAATRAWVEAAEAALGGAGPPAAPGGTTAAGDGEDEALRRAASALARGPTARPAAGAAVSRVRRSSRTSAGAGSTGADSDSAESRSGAEFWASKARSGSGAAGSAAPPKPPAAAAPGRSGSTRRAGDEDAGKGAAESGPRRSARVRRGSGSSAGSAGAKKPSASAFFSKLRSGKS